MRTILKTLVVFVLSLGAVGCGPLNRPARNPADLHPSADKARVVVAFPQGFPWGEAYVLEGTDLRCYLRNKQHCVFDLSPGHHALTLTHRSTEVAEGDLEGGKVYHLRVFLTPGGFGDRVYWVALKNAGEDLDARKADLAESTEVELERSRAEDWQADNAEENRENLKEFRDDGEKPVELTSEHGL